MPEVFCTYSDPVLLKTISTLEPDELRGAEWSPVLCKSSSFHIKTPNTLVSMCYLTPWYCRSAFDLYNTLIRRSLGMAQFQFYPKALMDRKKKYWIDSPKLKLRVCLLQFQIVFILFSRTFFSVYFEHLLRCKCSLVKLEAPEIKKKLRKDSL